MKGLYKQKGSNVWWYRFTPAPKAAQVRVSTGCTDEAEAIVAARRIQAEAGQEAAEDMASSEGEITAYLAHLARDGLSPNTIQSRGYILRPFVAAVKAGTPHDITPSAVQSWFDGRWKEYEHTAVAYLNVVSWWLEWLVDRRKLAGNPAKGVVVPQKLPMQRRRRFLKPKEARKVLDDCEDPKLKFALLSALQAGMRKLEVIEAVPRWYDLEAGLIHIEEELPHFQPKDREKRTIPLTEEFKAFLKEYGLKEPFMLAPEVKRGSYRYRYDFRTAYENHMTACGFPDVTFHDLRRTFASILVSQGVSIYKVAKWLGDTVEQTENTYGHLIPQDDDINPAYAKRPAKKKAPAKKKGMPTRA